MARIKNDLFKLSGSLGGLSFSQDEFGTIVKQKPESNKKVKSSLGSQRTRGGTTSQREGIHTVPWWNNSKELKNI